MPKTPLRELKPELFADDEDKANIFTFDDSSSEGETDCGDDETDADVVGHELNVNEADVAHVELGIVNAAVNEAVEGEAREEHHCALVHRKQGDGDDTSDIECSTWL